MKNSANGKTGKTRIAKELKNAKNLLTILTEGEALRADNLLVSDFNSIFKLVTDMIYTMQRVGGVGLAASQVGINLQIAIALVDRKPLVLINPVVVGHSDEQTSIAESCLSCPGQSVRVPRWTWVTVDYYDVKGNKKWIQVDGMNAIVLQHEIDHILPEGGKLIIDHKETKHED